VSDIYLPAAGPPWLSSLGARQVGAPPSGSGDKESVVNENAFGVLGYGVHARDYLRRARRRLDDRTPESLFYAGMELRSGIESRMQQYIEAWADVEKKLKLGWRIAALSKQIERRFRIGDKIAHLRILSEDGKTLVADYFYTPVTKKLKKMAELLGNYLHAAEYHHPGEPWWQTMRRFLEEVYAELDVAVSGKLLGPPLRDRKTGLVDLHLEPEEGESPEVAIDRFGSRGTRRVMGIRYLDWLPELENDVVG